MSWRPGRLAFLGAGQHNPGSRVEVHLHMHLVHPDRPPAADAPPGVRGLRARVWRHQFTLDRDLAGGVRPDQTLEHEERARQLCSSRCRRFLINEHDSALAKAAHPPSWHSVTLPVQAAAVLAARLQLSALRQALLESEPPSVRGAAIASCLLNDPQSPLRHADTGQTIIELATAAIAALAPDDASPNNTLAASGT